ncbi:MAG TPA: heat-inducible transcription repressor HrcA [Erysipelothrix sp.]|nr:heat-inducible transcription repressor HrcA [Erysipelothrix sp.]
MLSERRIEIFRAIVYEFIRTAEPIGSKTLIDKYKWNYSSATIRNEMSALEEMGLLEKPHTSAGRVPSTKGYQFYTQYLMEDNDENERLKNSLQVVFSNRGRSVEETLMQSVEILAEMTNLTSGVLGPEATSQCLQDIKVVVLDETRALVIFETNQNHRESKVFALEDNVSIADLQKYVKILNDRLCETPITQIQEKMESLRPILQQSILQYESLFEAFSHAFIKFASDRMYFSGKNNLLNQPEFGDVEKLKQLLNMLENSSLWADISMGRGDLRLKTGDHSQTIWIDDMAVVTSEINIAGEESHQLVVVGPSRMEYSKVVSLVEYISKMIEEVYSDESE